MFLDQPRRHAFLPLTEAAVPTDALERLACLGITTLDELRDQWAYGNRQLIVEFLGDSPLRFTSQRPLAGATRGAAAGAAGPSINLQAVGMPRPLVRRPRGVLLPLAERRTPAEPPEPLAARPPGARLPSAGPPRTLAASFPPPRNQGQRGTCVAFASVALLEYHLYDASPKTRRHAEQFVYWACKQNDGYPDAEGTLVSVARDALRQRGACLHKTWRYRPLPQAGNESQAPPPAGAETEALKYLCRTVRRVAAKNPDRLREQLDARRPVVLSVRTFPAWDYPTTADTGEIPLPIPGEMPDGGHAVCVVGYETNDRVPGGGLFVFRNSWGASWAKPHGRLGPGYGALPFAYVSKYGLEAFA